MRFLRTNTAARITVGPFFDKTDGVTPETAITVTNCKLTLVVDVANVPTLVLDVAPTASGGSNDMVHITGDDAGFYDLELAAANVNYLGRAMLALTDAATHCPVFHEFMIVPADVYDALFLGTDTLDVNVATLAAASISSSTFAAGAITASVLANDCIGSDELAASAVAEITPASGSNVASSGTAQAGSTSTTLVLASGASSVNSSYLGLEVYIHTGTGLGQARTIVGYVGATRVATVDRAWEVTPDNTSQYAVRPWRAAALDTVGRGLLGSAGVDAIIVDATDGSVNLRQAAGIILSTSAGVVAGADDAVPGPIEFYAKDGSTVIVSAQHDGRGNRTAVVWTPPA